MRRTLFRSHALVSRSLRLTAVAALVVPALAREARAQTEPQKIAGGFSVRQITFSTGYASIELPPITLGGNLPTDILNADLVTSGTVAIDWHRVTPRTSYGMALDGAYNARTRYPELNAPGANLSFGVARLVGTKWRLGAAAATAISSSDQMAFQPTQTGRLVEGAASFDDLAGTVALARSPSPDLSQAVLFVPIRQTLVASDVYGSRIIASSAKAEAVYTHSPRVAVSVHGNYTNLRRISSSHEPGLVLEFPDAAAENAGIGFRYGRTERNQVTAAVDWSQTSGAFAAETIDATVGHAWSGRKWFTAATVGTSFRPFQPAAVTGPVTVVANPRPALIYTALVGYKFRSQTLLAEYSRSSHDQYGHGGRNVATGFEGDVQSVVSSWFWSSPRSRWTTRADFSMLRGPGNFSYIYAWLSTFGVGRQLQPNLRVTGEALFDRHGSRMFEGFHLTRTGARLNLVWTPTRRPVG